MKAIVIGSGYAGALAAYRLRRRFSADVTVLEHAPEPGGMLRTFRTEEGLPYEYGPRVLSVFRGVPESLDFLAGFANLQERTIYQGTRLRPEYPVVPFPVDRESLLKLPCADDIRADWTRNKGVVPDETNLRTYLESSVGPTLTELAFAPFNIKFWGKTIDDMPAEWGKLRRLERVAESGEYRLPSVAPHYYPEGGFNPIIDQLLEGVDVRYGVTVRDITSDAGRPTVHAEAGGRAENLPTELVISTAPIDKVMGLRYGELEWKGYRIETETVREPSLGRAPDGVPFSWLYTPWLETPVCRTTDFGVIHHGPDNDRPSVVVREIADDRVKMYPVHWETEKFYQYLADAARVRGVVPLGRLGLYKYVTTDSTYAMVERLIDNLAELAEATPDRRLEIFRDIRGDWSN